MTTNALLIHVEGNADTHMIARVSQPDEHGTTYWRAGSASGPLGTGWENLGPLEVGQDLNLAYNYDTDEYAVQHGWPCTVVRVNRVTVTVKSFDTGHTHKVEI